MLLIKDGDIKSIVIDLFLIYLRNVSDRDEDSERNINKPDCLPLKQSLQSHLYRKDHGKDRV